MGPVSFPTESRVKYEKNMRERGKGSDERGTGASSKARNRYTWSYVADQPHSQDPVPGTWLRP